MPGPASMSASTSLKFAGGILYADTVYKRLDPSSNHGEEPRITLSITSVGYNTPCTKGSLCLSVCDCMYLRVLPSFEPSCLIGRRNPAYGDLFGEVAPRLTSFPFRKEVTRACSLGQTRCQWFLPATESRGLCMYYVYVLVSPCVLLNIDRLLQ